VESLADDVRREVSRLGPQAEIGRFVDAWPAAVGEQIARNAWPARVSRDGTLQVNTCSSAWAFELAQLETDIRARLGAIAPKRIRFAPGPLPEPETPARVGDAAHALRPSPAERKTAASLAARIADENLRKLVARAAAASLARARSDRGF
jgi:hypothetical protein